MKKIIIIISFILISFKVFSSEIYRFKFVTNDKNFPIHDSIVMDDIIEFSKYKKLYRAVIEDNFTKNQMKSILEIRIANSILLDTNEIGNCRTVMVKSGTFSYITISAKNPEHIKILIHEILHAIYYDNIDLFEMNYQNKWKRCKQYVNKEFKNDFNEDFAITGTYYLLDGNQKGLEKKLKLFENFLEDTK